jgi:hypothetical protein
MRHLLCVAVPGLLLPQAGCIPFGCGGYTGTHDAVYSRNGTDTLILCADDDGTYQSYVVDTGSPTTTDEGYFHQTTHFDQERELELEHGSAVHGSTARLAFDVQFQPDGSLLTPQLGPDAWQAMDLDKVALDHADTRCVDLHNRSWWGTNEPGRMDTYAPIPGGDSPDEGSGSRLILCDNGGFVADLESESMAVEGFYSDSKGSLGSDDSPLFVLSPVFDQTGTGSGVSTTGLGATSITWGKADDVQDAFERCSDLENRPWWSAQP